MNEDPNCCNDGCECQGEKLSYAPDYQPEGNTISSNDLSGTISFNGSGMTVGGDFQTDNRVKMHDLVVKQMDYGYLVKAGCQTLCVETQDHLIQLFEAYVRDPEKVRELHRKNKLDTIYVDAAVKKFEKKPDIREPRKEVNVAVVGYSLEDVKNFMADVVPLAVRGVTPVRKYMLETPDHILYYYGVSNIDHCRGMDFDRITETHRARENRDFSKILECLQATLKRHNQ